MNPFAYPFPQLDDLNLNMDKDRGRIAELEKKQRNFDKMLAEEKAVSERLSAERDTAERDARQYETKVRLC